MPTVKSYPHLHSCPSSFQRASSSYHSEAALTPEPVGSKGKEGDFNASEHLVHGPSREASVQTVSKAGLKGRSSTDPQEARGSVLPDGKETT